MWRLVMVLLVQHSSGIEIISPRYASSQNLIHKRNFLDQTAKTSPQLDQATPTPALSKQHEGSAGGNQSTSDSQISPTTTKISVPDLGSELLETVNASELISMIGDALLKKVEGVPKPTLKDLSLLSVCTVSDQLMPVFYNRRLFICCEGLHNRTSKADICCEKQVVSGDDVFCCSDKIHQKSKTNNSACCGDKLYNPKEEICCGSKIYTQSNNSSRCCGSELYDMRTKICCYDLFVHDRKDGDQCCGMHVFHSATNTCCYGNVQPAYGKNNKKGLCCAEKNVHARCYTCTPNTNIPVPLFDVNEQICCGGKIRTRLWNNTQCCGKNAMNGHTQTCMNNTIQSWITTAVLHGQHDNASDIPTTIQTNQTIGRVPLSGNHKHEISTLTFQAQIICIAGGGAIFFISVGGLVYYCIRRRKKRGPHSETSSQERPLINHSVLNNMYSETFVSYNSQDSRSVMIGQRPRNMSRCSLRSHISKTSMSISMPLETSMSAEDDAFITHATLCYQNDLTKDIIFCDQNMSDSLVRNSYTQTVCEKECNLQNTFGRRFDNRYMVDGRNPTIQMQESEEKVTLPQSLLKNQIVETHCSTYWDIGEILQKFAVPSDESIASPVAEYLLTGYKEIPDYAVIVKPFIGSPDQLKVYKFSSDHGAHPSGELIEVPRREKQNEKMDMFYLTEGNLVYIFTKSFSGFFCTTCKHSRNLNLTAFLYGSYKRFPQGQDMHKYEVRLKLYIVDELLKFKDFQQDIERQERIVKRSLLARQQLELSDIMTVEDEVEMSMIPTSEGWTEKLHPKRSRPIFNASEKILLKDLAEQCQDCPNLHTERTVPYGKEWYLVSREGCKVEPTFQCLVEVNCIGNSEESQGVASKENTIIVDDLTLPQIHLQNNEDDRRIAEIKDFLTKLEGVKKQRLIDAIRQRRKVTGNSLDELFDCMRQTFKTEGLTEEIFIALDRCQMQNEIKILQARGLFPAPWIPRPTQREESHVEQGACCKDFEGLSLTIDNRQRHHTDNNGKGYFPGNRSASENNLQCRREMSNTVTSSVSGPPGCIFQEPEIGQTLQDRYVDFSDSSLQAPVQEHASMEETKPLKLDKSNQM